MTFRIYLGSGVAAEITGTLNLTLGPLTLEVVTQLITPPLPFPLVPPSVPVPPAWVEPPGEPLGAEAWVSATGQIMAETEGQIVELELAKRKELAAIEQAARNQANQYSAFADQQQEQLRAEIRRAELTLQRITASRTAELKRREAEEAAREERTYQSRMANLAKAQAALQAKRDEEARQQELVRRQRELNLSKSRRRR